MIIEKYGDPREKVRRNALVPFVQSNNDAFHYLSAYKLPDNRNLPAKVQQEYYTNAILLDACGKLIADRKSFIKSRGGKAKNMWDELVRLLSDLQSGEYPHSLPANPRRLEERFKRYREEGLLSLVHKNFCNKAAAKINNVDKETFMVELLADPRNLDNVQVCKIFNMIADKMEWKKISPSTVAKWRDQKEMETTPGRRGTVAFNNTIAMQVKRSRPTAPLLYWTLDGWDAELLYQKFDKDKTVYHNRPTVVIVLDPCVNYPIGYAIGTHETPELISAALRNAVDHTSELFGKRYITKQLQSDHYAIKKMTPIYTAISKHYTPAQVKNAKSKVIEPYFGHINKEYCQLMPNWSGFGVTSRKENQPNVDAINRNRKNLPDWNEVVDQLERIIKMERSLKIAKYMSLWISAPKEDLIELTKETYLYWFGEQTGETNKMQGSGLRPTILGIKREYDSYDINFREHYSTKWTVKFDPYDLSEILAVNEDHTRRFMLTQKFAQPMALADRKPGDFDEMQKVVDYNKKLRQVITDRREFSGNRVREIFDETPALNDTLAKMILVDSRGQHKDRRNDYRAIEAGNTKIKRISATVVTEEEDDELDIFKRM
ncbi:MAG: hypothetical protein JZU65_06240 [Chlorobium sp.]|nr:hypothetical protein [Chlorobium sp.]